MTDLSTAPMTRRELRMAERAAEEARARTLDVTPPTPVPTTVEPVGVVAVATPLPAQRVRETAAPSPQTPGTPPAPTSPVVTGAPSAAVAPAPLTRRAIREAERAAAACPPPFTPVLTAPAPVAEVHAPRAGAAFRVTPTFMAKSGLVLALSGALLVTGFGGHLGTGSEGMDGAAVRAEAEADARAAALAAEAARVRADDAATARLSAGAAAYAANERAEAVEVALTTLATADEVGDEARSLVGGKKIRGLDVAAAKLEKLIDRGQDATLTSATRRPVPVAGSSAPAAGATAPLPEVPSATELLRSDEAASRSGRAAPSPLAPEVATLEQLPEHLTVQASADLQQSAQIIAAADRLATLAEKVEDDAAAALERKQAREAAARELARKVAAVIDSPNGAVDEDLLCSPDFAPGELLRCDAAAALEKLNRAYRADHGYDLDVTSSYRSYAEQVATRAARGSLAATPGTSNHGIGIAVDLGGFGGVGYFGDADYLWMKQNAGRYGWFHPAIMEPGGGGPLEPWHWEYGGE